ncbi:MAG: nickel-dependent lactate racemase [Actinobacteria bacterium]|nr:nickel-dependent lactate racemase [Actinomycetota bacterium]
MRVSIPYGRSKVELDIPQKNILDIVTGRSGSFPGESHEDRSGILPGNEPADEPGMIDFALNHPIGSGRLCSLAEGKRNACILASDISRPCPSHKFLPALAGELNRGGIGNDRIKVILGLGIHRRHTQQEQRELVGGYIYDNCRVMDSDPSRTRLIGYTRSGTPVEVFEEALDNGLLIATGNIEYHYFAGYSGGAKAVMPGVCTRNSIQANHSMMLDERACAGNYENNPVRIDMEEAGRITGIDFIFNVILDDRKNIIDAVAGKNNEAWLEGIRRYDRTYRIEVESPADIVIASPGGFPKDINLYQSQKALENVKGIVKDGGTIIIMASCSEGFGEDVFESWMAGVRDYELISRRLKEEFVLGGHKAVAISRVISKNKVCLFSCFGRPATEKIGFEKLDDVQQYLDSRLRSDPGLKITVVPGGRFVKVKNK